MDEWEIEQSKGSGFVNKEPLLAVSLENREELSRVQVYRHFAMENKDLNHRRQFFVKGAKAVLAFALGGTLFGMKANSREEELVQPQTVLFKDDGTIPNSRYPLLLFRNALRNPAAGSEVQSLFATNNWSNGWQNGVYPFHHYHSTSHEVLGIYRGSASLRLGGEKGETFEVRAGDLIIIPAGVGHKNLGSSDDFGVVGAYPDGRSWDLLTGKPGERPQADQNIASLPIPETNPIYGKDALISRFWI